ncbi:ATP-binding protein [Sulfurimonas sp.]|uniref:PAS domain-containing sensor histidine kinase n=1 Tax=Sulfurimonas sp. TaxID=2022749 RepID=UPI002637FD52|nr:ATP-binding protein [Sulfurimonas sp.]MDD5156881.1 PAS domain S-box protein [Sulfurimonas sp.]
MHKQFIRAIEKSNIISKTDIDGIITFVNDEFCAISGYAKDELIGKNHNIIKDPDANPAKFKLLWDTINAKNIYKDTVKNLAKDGSVFYLNTTIIPILDEHDEIVEFVAIRYDVTQEVMLKDKLLKKEQEYEELNRNLEKRVEEQTIELKKLNKTLEKRVKDEIEKNKDKQEVMFLQSRHASLGQMLANIAHQWRQPLTELSLTIFNIKKSAQNSNTDGVAKFYSESKNIIQNMSQTIDDFSNFFKPNKAKNYFNISNSIKESLVLLDNIIKEEAINIKTDLVDIEVLGVENELTQVIINLIHNSKDAFISNGILIKEINITLRKDHEFAIIEVEDNAGGIKKDNIDKIFEPYFTTKHKSRGTGLGLFMSKMICEQGLHGTIDAKSKKQTTTFSIKIPLASV